MNAEIRKTIEVGGRHLTVHKHTFEMSLSRYVAAEAARKEDLFPEVVAEEGHELTWTEAAALSRRRFHTTTYPTLSACTIGDLWTEDECRNAITEDDLDLWISTATELNPDWFNATETKEEAEKNE